MNFFEKPLTLKLTVANIYVRPPVFITGNETL